MNKKLQFVVNKGNFFLSHRVNIAEKAIKDGYEVHVLTDASLEVAKEMKKKAYTFIKYRFQGLLKYFF